MRKLLFLLVCTLATAYCKAQNISYGTFIGLNETSIPLHNDTKLHAVNPYGNVDQAGFSFGGVVNYKINKYLSLQPGLYITKKGGTTKNDTVEISTGIPLSVGTTKLELYYAETPINLLFNVPLADATLFAGGGGYVAARLSSSLLFHINGDESGYSQSADYPPTLNKTDLGYNILAGIRFAKGITIRIGYEKSLTSIYHGQPSAKNQGWNYAIGYMFK